MAAAKALTELAVTWQDSLEGDLPMNDIDGRPLPGGEELDAAIDQARAALAALLRTRGAADDPEVVAEPAPCSEPCSIAGWPSRRRGWTGATPWRSPPPGPTAMRPSR